MYIKVVSNRKQSCILGAFYTLSVPITKMFIFVVVVVSNQRTILRTYIFQINKLIPKQSKNKWPKDICCKKIADINNKRKKIRTSSVSKVFFIILVKFFVWNQCENSDFRVKSQFFSILMLIWEDNSKLMVQAGFWALNKEVK